MIPPSVADEIEVLLADGTTWLVLSLVETYDRDGNVEHPTLSTQLAALVANLPLGQKLHPQMWTNTGGGIGIDYTVAYGLYTRTAGIVTPAGAATQVTIPAGNNSQSSIVAIEEFGADLFMAQTGTGSANTARVIRSVGGTGTGGGAFADSLNLAAGTGDMRDLCLFSNGAGVRYLYASSDSNSSNGILHRWNGAVWASTAPGTFGGNGRGRMWRTFWTDRSGVGWPRLVTISGANKISYTIPGGDPFLAASWVEGVEIDTAKTLLELGGARKHVFMGAADNLFDLNEYGESPALTSYWQQMPQTGNAQALQYLNGYLYASLGRGLDRVYVDSQTPLLQENIGQCAPGWGTKAENDVRGYITAMCPDQGYLVAAVYNSTVTKSFICWGLPKSQRSDIREDSANPLLWYGPEITGDADRQVTRMRTSGLAGDMRLWITSNQVSTAGPDIVYITLPIAGAPLQDLISGGAMRFANGTTGSTWWQKQTRLELMPTPWTGTTQIVDQSVVLTRGLSKVRQTDGSIVDDGIGTKITQRFTADPPPGAITWPSGDDVTITPSQTVNPSATKKGDRIWQRLDFFSPNGAATPPKIGVLDACRVDAWLVSPTAVALPTLTVQYGVGIRTLTNAELADRDPDWVTAQLKTLTSSGRTTLKLRDGKRYTVKFEQALETSVEYGSGDRYAGKVVTTRLSGLLLSDAL